ncbi:MAG: DUF4956 domain-containing protein [Candidatus Hinthialibacter sp.]
MNNETISNATGNLLDSIGGALTDIFSTAASNPLSAQYHEELSYVQILVSLSVAAILGSLIAYHPKRHIESMGPVSDREMRNTQILICVAGAIMVVLIQGSLERAFGLVGLGSFVRYRTALRNPFDLSIIFVLIGLGMASGLENYKLAFTVTGFIYILLYVMALNKSAYQHRWQLRIDSNDPLKVDEAFRDIAQRYNFKIIKLRRSRETGRFNCLFIAKRPFNTDELTQEIKQECGDQTLFSRFDWELEKE